MFDEYFTLIISFCQLVLLDIDVIRVELQEIGR